MARATNSKQVEHPERQKSSHESTRMARRMECVHSRRRAEKHARFRVEGLGIPRGGGERGEPNHLPKEKVRHAGQIGGYGAWMEDLEDEEQL